MDTIPRTASKIKIEISSPRGIVREAVKTRILTEGQGSLCMEMIESRNKTSHVYHEEIAHDIAQKIPEHYKLLHAITQKLYNNSIKEDSVV